MMMNTHALKTKPVSGPAARAGVDASSYPGTGGSRANGAQTSFSRFAAYPACSSSAGDLSPVVADLVEQLTQALQAGETVDIEALTTQFPEHAETIRRLFPALRQLAGLRSVGSSGSKPIALPCARLPIEAGRRLGDFQLVGELGRGGMGVVFEAVQESLGRRVALKVLPTAATLDSRARQRFQIEAQAAACLQHPNIVPVYAVDVADDIPYYAMQLVEGMSLADLILNLRRLVGANPPDERGAISNGSLDPLLSQLLLDRFDPTGEAARSNSGEPAQLDVAGRPATPAAPQVSWASGAPAVRSIRSSPYFRSVVRLGVQAALALEYAHGQGIVHRDIKPANLLIDRRGCLWVTDFGLARLPAESGLTRTGELVGTDRYMSPEQAVGKQALIDRRTDIYSLGATLYELLALQPAYGARNPHQILRQIAETDPARIRALNPAVPTDLVTVVAKAMARDPSARYLTAQHLADDLNRFLEGRPVAARPTPSWVRAMKSARRRPVLTALFLLVQLLVSALVVLGVWSHRRISREAEAVRRFANSESLARVNSQRISAALALDRGIALAESHQVGRGLHWMLRGLESAPVEAGDLRRVAAANLVSWSERASLPCAILPCTAPISALALSPDGRTVATGDDAGILTLWNADSGLRIDSALAPDARFAAVEFHPSGTLLATSGSSGIARLWDVRPLRPRGEAMPLATRVFNRIGFDPLGRSFPTVSCDGIVYFRDVQTGRPFGPRLDTHDRTANTLLGATFRPDGARILTYGRDGRAQLWDTATGQRLFAPLVHDGSVVFARFRADGRRIATARDNGTEGRVAVWDADTGRLLAQSERLPGGLFAVDFHPDGRAIAAGCRDGVVRLLDAETGQARGWPMTEAGAVNRFAFSPDGRLLATGSVDGTVWFFDACTGRPLGATPDHGGEISGLSFCPDGRRLFTASRDGAARVWDVTPITDPGRGIPLASNAQAADQSPDGRLLATDGIDGAARVFETATGRPFLPPLVHANGFVRFARFSPDGRLLATGGDDSMVQIWNVATGAPAGPPLPQPSWSRNARFSPDGRRLLIGHTGGTAALWDLATFRCIGPLLKHPVLAGHEIGHLAFDRAGRIAITGSMVTDRSEATVGFWNAATGGPLAPFARFNEGVARMVVGPEPLGPLYVVEGGRMHTLDLGSFRETRAPLGDRIEAIALAPGGTTMLIGGSDKTARLLDVASGQPIGAILEHDEPVRGVAIAPDGRTLLTLAGERIRFWDAATGKRLGPPRLHRSQVRTDRLDDRPPVFFSPDGRTAVSVGGSVVFWDVPGIDRIGTPDPPRLACSIRTLTGMDFSDSGDVRMLDVSDWQRRIADPGACGVGQAGPSPEDWHDRLALEAERSGHWFAALWHLDRLIARRPQDWSAHARRSRARRKAGDKSGADTDFALARELDAAGQLHVWQAHEDFDRATHAMTQGRWQAARTHLRRLAQSAGENPALLWRLAEADIRLERWGDAEVELAAAVNSVGTAGLESMFYRNLPEWLAAAPPPQRPPRPLSRRLPEAARKGRHQTRPAQCVLRSLGLLRWPRCGRRPDGPRANRRRSPRVCQGKLPADDPGWVRCRSLSRRLS